MLFISAKEDDENQGAREFTELLDVIIALENFEWDPGLIEEDAEGQPADASASNQDLGLACVVRLKVHGCVEMFGEDVRHFLRRL